MIADDNYYENKSIKNERLTNGLKNVSLWFFSVYFKTQAAFLHFHRDFANPLKVHPKSMIDNSYPIKYQFKLSIDDVKPG